MDKDRLVLSHIKNAFRGVSDGCSLHTREVHSSLRHLGYLGWHRVALGLWGQCPMSSRKDAMASNRGLAEAALASRRTRHMMSVYARVLGAVGKYPNGQTSWMFCVQV